MGATTATEWEVRNEPRPCSYWLSIGDIDWAVLPVHGTSCWEACRFDPEDGPVVGPWPFCSVAEAKRYIEAEIGHEVNRARPLRRRK
jgi:hypothetical protein